MVKWKEVISASAWLRKGLTTRKVAENAWLATRGRGLPFRDHVSQLIETEDDLPLVIEAPKRGHSRKPDEAYEKLEILYGDVRRLDLFARHERPGWTGWGNEMRQAPPLHRTVLASAT